jgi:prepilin-type N-terminal cleavage/methylation domain-containing protein
MLNFPRRLYQIQFGYTMIELMVVMLIITTVTVIGLAGYNRFNDAQRVKQAALTLKNNLRLAQNNAFSSLKPNDPQCKVLNSYKVIYIDINHYDIKPNCFTALDPQNNPINPTDFTGDRYTLPISVSMSDFETIEFGVLTRGVTGATTITLKGVYMGDNKLITISSSGDISGP